jgi:hypothetical protein
VFQNSPTDDVYHLKQKLVAIISKPAYNLPVNDVYHLKQKLEAIISKPAYNLPVIDVYHLKQKLEVMISKPAYNLPVLRACGVLPPCRLPHSFATNATFSLPLRSVFSFISMVLNPLSIKTKDDHILRSPSLGINPTSNLNKDQGFFITLWYSNSLTDYWTDSSFFMHILYLQCIQVMGTCMPRPALDAGPFHINIC